MVGLDMRDGGGMTPTSMVILSMRCGTRAPPQDREDGGRAEPTDGLYVLGERGEGV